jgi:hypothetical protein
MMENTGGKNLPVSQQIEKTYPKSKVKLLYFLILNKNELYYIFTLPYYFY